MARQKYGLSVVETSRILNEKTGLRPVCTVWADTTQEALRCSVTCTCPYAGHFSRGLQEETAKAMLARTIRREKLRIVYMTDEREQSKEILPLSGNGFLFTKSRGVFTTKPILPYFRKK